MQSCSTLVFFEGKAYDPVMYNFSFNFKSKKKTIIMKAKIPPEGNKWYEKHVSHLINNY